MHSLKDAAQIRELLEFDRDSSVLIKHFRYIMVIHAFQSVNT